MIRPFIVLLVALVAITAASQPPKNANTCQACRSAVSFARQLNSSTYRQEYKNVVEKFCEQYYQASTDFQTGPCQMFADGFFFILDQTDPVTHCDQIGACGTTQLPSDDIYDYIRADSDHSGALSLQGPDGPICEYCIQLLEQVKASLSNPNIVKQIKERTDAFCEFLKVIHEDKPCKEVVDKYLDLAVSFIGYLDSRQYCRSISMCPAKRAGVKLERQLPSLADFNNFGIETSVSIGSRPMSRKASTSQKASGECAFCKTIVKEMFKFVKDNKTEASIIEGLDKVCHILYPANRQGLEQCQGLVKAYTKELVELLIDETDPDMVCTLLGLCMYESKPKPRVAQIQPSDLNNLISYMDTNVKPGSPRSCIECKVFVSYLKTEIVKPESEEEVKEWLMNKLCKTLPTIELKSACKNMVDNYAPVFFRAIASDLDPQTACAELGACRKLQRVQLLDLASSSWLEESYTPRVQDQGCSRCVDIVARLDDYLSNHSPGEDIRALNRVCRHFLGTEMRRQCNNMIQQNGLDIVQMIPTMENPSQLCSQIKEC